MQSSARPSPKRRTESGPQSVAVNQPCTISRNRVVLAASELKVACRKSGARQARASVAKRENELSSTSASCAEKRRSA